MSTLFDIIMRAFTFGAFTMTTITAADSAIVHLLMYAAIWFLGFRFVKGVYNVAVNF